MEKTVQMGSAGRPEPAQDKVRQQQRAADPRGSGQQSGGESAQGQMGTVQFRDWASI